MDTEQEYQQQRLEDFRAKAKSARAATELIDLIDRPLLTAANWIVHSDNEYFIGAVKVDQHGNEYELRCSRLHKSIAGTLSPKRRPAKQTVYSSFKIAMGSAFQAREMKVRKFAAEDIDWRELVRQI